MGIVINGQVLPAVCDPGCIKCAPSNPSQCLLCNIGYYLSNTNTCSACSSTCKTCSSNSSNSCLSCYSNMFLSNNQCLQCTSTSNCLLCQSSNLTQCTACPVGYTLSSTSGTCQTMCSLNCLSCQSVSPYACLKCQSGYAPNWEGVCLPCASNCKSCSAYNYGICT